MGQWFIKSGRGRIGIDGAARPESALLKRPPLTNEIEMPNVRRRFCNGLTTAGRLDSVRWSHRFPPDPRNVVRRKLAFSIRQ